MPRHIFALDDSLPVRCPAPGDLIKNSVTGNFINIVISVSNLHRDSAGEFVYVRSVRYGKTNGNDFTLLNGQRSRSIKFRLNSIEYGGWLFVKEYVEYDNTAIRKEIVKRLRDVNTAYTPDLLHGIE